MKTSNHNMKGQDIVRPHPGCAGDQTCGPNLSFFKTIQEAGMSNVNVAPCPGVLLTVTLPPCSSAIERTTDKPRPVLSGALRAASTR